MPGIERQRLTAIRLGIYGGRALVQRDRVPLAARRAVWRTGRWHRARKGRHHPAKRLFIKWLLQSHIETDFCIERLAKDWKITPRTLRTWKVWVEARGAITVLDEGYGRREGLRIRCNRAQLYELLTELDQGEHELRDRRRRRYAFRWPKREANKRKPDRSPIPLSEKREKDLEPLSAMLGRFAKHYRNDQGRRPPATRFGFQTAFGGQLREENGEQKAQKSKISQNAKLPSLLPMRASSTKPLPARGTPPVPIVSRAEVQEGYDDFKAWYARRYRELAERRKLTES